MSRRVSVVPLLSVHDAGPGNARDAQLSPALNSPSPLKRLPSSSKPVMSAAYLASMLERTLLARRGTQTPSQMSLLPPSPGVFRRLSSATNPDVFGSQPPSARTRTEAESSDKQDPAPTARVTRTPSSLLQLQTQSELPLVPSQAPQLSGRDLWLSQLRTRRHRAPCQLCTSLSTQRAAAVMLSGTDGTPAPTSRPSSAPLDRGVVLRAAAVRRRQQASTGSDTGSVHSVDDCDDEDPSAGAHELVPTVWHKEWGYTTLGYSASGMPRVERVATAGIGRARKHAAELGAGGIEALSDEAVRITVAHQATRRDLELDRHCRVADIRGAFAELTQELGTASCASALRLFLRGKELRDDGTTVFEQGVRQGSHLEAKLLPAPQLLRWSPRIKASHMPAKGGGTAEVLLHHSSAEGGAVCLLGPSANVERRLKWTIRVLSHTRKYSQHVGLTSRPPKLWQMNGFNPQHTPDVWAVEDDGTLHRGGVTESTSRADKVGWTAGDTLTLTCDPSADSCTVVAKGEQADRQWGWRLPPHDTEEEEELEPTQWYLFVHLISEGTALAVSLVAKD